MPVALRFGSKLHKYHLYRDKLKFEVASKGVGLGSLQLPPGVEEEDAIFGRMVVYRDDVKIRLPLNRIDPDIQATTLKVVSQGCADAGVCYPPRLMKAGSYCLFCSPLLRAREEQSTSRLKRMTL